MGNFYGNWDYVGVYREGLVFKKKVSSVPVRIQGRRAQTVASTSLG